MSPATIIVGVDSWFAKRSFDELSSVGMPASSLETSTMTEDPAIDSAITDQKPLRSGAMGTVNVSVLGPPGADLTTEIVRVGNVPAVDPSAAAYVATPRSILETSRPTKTHSQTFFMTSSSLAPRPLRPQNGLETRSRCT